LKNKTVE